jgi:hypothetical protein
MKFHDIFKNHAVLLLNCACSFSFRISLFSEMAFTPNISKRHTSNFGVGVEGLWAQVLGNPANEQGSSGCPLCIMLQQNIIVCLLLGMVVLSGVTAGAALPNLVAGLSTFMAHYMATQQIGRRPAAGAKSQPGQQMSCMGILAR